jgi:hypothetical protein
MIFCSLALLIAAWLLMRPHPSSERIETERVKDAVRTIIVPVNQPEEDLPGMRRAVEQLRRVDVSRVPEEVRAAVGRLIAATEADLAAHDAGKDSRETHKEMEAAATNFSRAVGRHTTTPF